MSSAVPIKKYFILFLNRHNAYCSVKCKKKNTKKNYFVHNYIFWIALNFTGCLPLTLTFRVIEFKLSFIKYNNYWDSKFEIEKYKKPWKTEENLKGYGVGVCQNIMREKSIKEEKQSDFRFLFLSLYLFWTNFNWLFFYSMRATTHEPH